MLGEVFLCWVYLADYLLDITVHCEDVLLLSRAPCAGFSSRLSILPFVGYRGDMKVATVGVKFPRTFVLGEVFFLIVKYVVPSAFG